MRRACDGVAAVLSVVVLSVVMLAVVLSVVVPVPAAAQEPGGRAVELPADAPGVIVITLIVVAVVLLVAVVGYLYRRERGLDWDFQQPDEPAGEEEAGHGAH